MSARRWGWGIAARRKAAFSVREMQGGEPRPVCRGMDFRL